MNAKEKIEELLEASEDGTITAAQVTEAGLHRSVLQEFVKSGEMYRFGRGLYVRSSAWEDDFYLLQRKYGRGIYSHDTALYLLGYSDRTPAKYTMTFPKGYNAPSLKQENLIIKRVVPENLSSNSAMVKLSLFIFPLKFCGVVPIRRASSATLISDRTHSTLICSEIVISGTSSFNQLLLYKYKS